MFFKIVHKNTHFFMHDRYLICVINWHTPCKSKLCIVRLLSVVQLWCTNMLKSVKYMLFRTDRFIVLYGEQLSKMHHGCTTAKFVSLYFIEFTRFLKRKKQISNLLHYHSANAPCRGYYIETQK